ncbi:MAG: PhzF family phenazine biosynthesis protein [Anaerolineae bacterium]|nr:PhzF family phenazine biosynthesis protein [Anaerolineae bacterium]
MEIPIFQVDAFTDKPFAGNPAGVCLLQQPMPDAWQLDLAREMNLSETAFLQRRTDGWGLRWFTPQVEVELCGHATLASAHILWETGHCRRDEIIHFHTLSGELTAGWVDGWIELDLPLRQVTEAPLPEAILQALRGLPVLFAGRSGENYFIETASQADVLAVQPDFALLLTQPGHGLIVTARSEQPGVDFVSRYFAPWVGIPEDPVTGSAHCSLAPYWETRLGRSPLAARQVSARGGSLRVTCRGERVAVQGQAVTVIAGSIYSLIS